MSAVVVDEALREGVLDIAQRAGAAIMQVYASGFDIEQKADDSPVTTADLAAHQAVAP